MMFRQKCVVLLSSLVLVASTALSSTQFIVRHIEVKGLQKINASTVLSAIPLHLGQTYTDERGKKIIETIYKTGLFSNVQLKREGNALVVQVMEYPAIGAVNITGNKSISAKELKPVLKRMGIVVGQIFNPEKLHTIVVGLQQQYIMLGRNDAVVTPTTENMSRHRVAVNIRIQEGQPTIVRRIQIIGNSSFSQRELLSQFKLTTPSLLTWFTHDDRYSKIRLEEDLQQLQDFYFDHGYLEFHILSQEVTPASKEKGVAIVVHVSEGSVYYLSGYRLESYVPSDLEPEVVKILSQLKPNSIFSKKQIIDISHSIGDCLANHGYAFAQINPIPQIDRNTHRVYLIYNVKSGERVYVNNIHIRGNTHTSGTVVRTQLRQMEGSVYSLKNVNESKRLIQNLGYLDQVNVTTVPVSNTNNQVDLNYHVHEVSAGRASVQAGYSDVDGFLYGASISEPNFMGSGRYVSLGFQNSAYSSSYNFSYNNPFYTVTGISRGFSVFYNHTTPANVNIDPYTMDDYGTSVTYGIPIGEYDQLNVGGGYDHTAISNVNSSLVSPSVTNFLSKNPSPFNQFKLTTGVSHATLDRAIFPNNGNAQGIDLTLGIPVLKSSLSYYQLSYSGRWFFPMGYGFIFNPHATMGYGNGYGSTHVLPFFNNFFAGGLTTLPGYEANTLGPKNPADVSQALGGNVEALGGVNLLLPNFISDKVRTGVLLDAGNIFQTNHVTGISYESIALKNLRVTTGIMVSWWSPLGAPLDFSLAIPLNKKPGDQLDLFSFSFGAAI